MTATPELRVFDKTDHSLIVLSKPVLISIWWGPGEEAELLRMMEYTRVVDDECAGGFASLVVIEPGGRKFSPEAREAAMRLSKSVWKNHRATAQVIEGKGIAMSAARAIATVMMTISNPRAPHRIFDDTASAAAWLAQQMGSTELSGIALLNVVERLRKNGPQNQSA